MSSFAKTAVGFLTITSTILLNGCMHSSELAATVASASLLNAQNEDSGSATILNDAGRMILKIDARGVPAGTHGIHIHQVGKCDAPSFESAGPHWNPSGRKHGLSNSAGPHAGDIPNIQASSTGSVKTSVSLRIASEIGSIFDVDGAALVIHATADDNVTDPSGNSGSRILCGVFNATN